MDVKALQTSKKLTLVDRLPILCSDTDRVEAAHWLRKDELDKLNDDPKLERLIRLQAIGMHNNERNGQHSSDNEVPARSVAHQL
jgi:hypothetical protein